MKQPFTHPSPRWQFFSPIETEIISSITNTPGSAAEIAKRTGIPLSGNLRYTLANLVSRKVLVIGCDGYQLFE